MRAASGIELANDQLHGHIQGMKQVSIAEAKAHLSELVTVVAEGGEVMITRRNKPIARLVSADAQVRKPREPFDFERLRKHIEKLKSEGEPVVDTDEAIRDWRQGERR
jgi:prevent-host-death family protein